MKYKLNKNCKIKMNKQNIIVTDLSSSCQIFLEYPYVNIFKELFIKRLDDSVVIENIKTNIVNDNLKALKLLNSVIYTVSNAKMLLLDNQYDVEKKKLFVNSCLIEITNSCNFRCPHCYVDKANCKNISYEELIKIARELKQIKCNLVTFTGGEVFTHKDFLKIYEYFYKMGFIITINSNGSLINKEVLNMFNDYPPCRIEISLYGYDNRTYKEFTQVEKMYDIVTQNVELLKSLGIKVLLKSVITNKNKKCFNKIGNVANNLGCRFKSDFISFPQTNIKGSLNQEQISVDEVLEYLTHFSNSKQYYLSLFSQPKNITNKVFKCKVNDDAIFITSEKKVCMCVCMQSASVPYTDLLTNVLELSKLKQMRYKKDAKCYNCKYISLCRYCPGKFEMTTGNYQVPPEWFCSLGKGIYNTYVAGFNIIQKRFLKKFELDQAFDIISKNMVKIGFTITKNDKKIWSQNIKKNILDNNFYFYLIYLDGEICGFAEVMISDDKLYISEIQLCDNVKNSRVLFKTLKHLLYQQAFQGFDEVFYNVNNNNNISIKTFSHLGGRLVERREKSSLYCIDKKDIVNYFNKFKF